MIDEQGQTQDPSNAPEIVIDIPGVGVRAFPGTMQLPQIQENIKFLQMEARTKASQDARAAMKGQGNTYSALGEYVMNPELIAGGASLIPGVGTLAAGGIGAGTSIARDIYRGDTDPTTMTLRALSHGAVNMIPGAVGGMVARRAMPKAAEVGIDMATHGPVRGGVMSMLRAALGAGEKVAPAGVVRGVEAGGELAGMELPGGIKVASDEGVAFLKQEIQKLGRQGKDLTDPTYAALNELWRKAVTQLEKHGTSATDLVQKSGAPVTTAAERAAMARANQEAVRATAQTQKGSSIANRLRLLLGGASVGRDIGTSGSW